MKFNVLLYYTDGDKYYYNTETKHAQPDHPNPGNDLPANWIETTTKLKYEEKPKELINQLMHGFMEVSKEYCDKIESSSGFIVRQIDKLTAEVYNIQQAGGTPGDIDNDVNVDACASSVLRCIKELMYISLYILSDTSNHLKYCLQRRMPAP